LPTTGISLIPWAYLGSLLMLIALSKAYASS
jgi:hypothetical protein